MSNDSNRITLEAVNIDSQGDDTVCSLANDTYYIDIKTSGAASSCVCRDRDNNYLVKSRDTNKGAEYEVFDFHCSSAKMIA